MTEQARECAEYFRQTPGFKRVMAQLLIRYRRNGCASGTVRLEAPSEEERDALCGLFGRAFLGDVKFKVQDFQTAVQSSRFGAVELKDVLEAYFQTTIHTNKERRDQKEQQFQQMLHSASQAARSDTCKRWLEAIQEKRRDRGYLLLIKEMAKDFPSATESLWKAIRAMDTLERQTQPPLRRRRRSGQESENSCQIRIPEFLLFRGFFARCGGLSPLLPTNTTNSHAGGCVPLRKFLFSHKIIDKYVFAGIYYAYLVNPHSRHAPTETDYV